MPLASPPPSSRPRRFPLAARSLPALLLVLAPAAYQGCSSDDETPPADAGTDLTGEDRATAAETGSDAGGSPDVAAPDAADAAPNDAIADAPSDADLDADGGECVGDDPANGVASTLRCSGLYSDWNTKTIATGVRPFTPAHQLWSDGALKSRWILLPPGTQINNANPEEWTFPVGTRTWKEFRLGTKRIETRHMKKTGSTTWAMTVYRWSSDELTTSKLDTGEANVGDAGYEIPTSGQCVSCHGGRIDTVLGFESVLLGSPGAAGTTLADLVSQNLLTNVSPQTMPIPNDGTGIARNPVGWLHANCGITCHNRNPAALAFTSGLYLRVSATQLKDDAGTQLQHLDPWITSVNVIPGATAFANQGYKRIKPSDANLSLIRLYDATRTPNDAGIPQMPPILSHAVPVDDVAALSAWINAMP